MLADSKTCKATFLFLNINPHTVRAWNCVARTIRTDREWTNEWGTVGAKGSQTVFLLYSETFSDCYANGVCAPVSTEHYRHAEWKADVNNKWKKKQTHTVLCGKLNALKLSTYSDTHSARINGVRKRNQTTITSKCSIIGRPTNYSKEGSKRISITEWKKNFNSFWCCCLRLFIYLDFSRLFVSEKRLMKNESKWK